MADAYRVAVGEHGARDFYFASRDKSGTLENALYQWRAIPGLKSDAHTHEAAQGFGHALLAPLVGQIFRTLGVSAAVHEHGDVWFPLNNEPSVSAFERGHAVANERGAYNTQAFATVARTQRPLRGRHAGFWDLFVPIVVDKKAVATLVTGPFARAWPTSAHIQECWRWLTGRPGRPNDPEFAAYLATTLSTLVLDDARLASFERLLGLFCRLMSGTGNAGELMTDIERLEIELIDLRFAERSWSAVREMVDERFVNAWRTEGANLRRLGLSRVPDHVLVGLAVSRTPSSDPVDESLRRHALQRRAVDLARSTLEVVAGQVGEHGIVFLSSAGGSVDRKRQRLFDLADRISRVAQRQFALSLHFGASVPQRSTPLDFSYRSALGSAEAALARGERIAVTDAGARVASLSQLRKELGRAIDDGPGVLTARFDRYLEAVAAECAYRLEPARGHVEAGFERIAEPLVGVGALDASGLALLTEKLERAAGEAQGLPELFAAYRRAVVDLADATVRPSTARQDRNLRVALDHIHQHYTEPLRLTEIARRAGFAPGHFSKLFIARERMSLQHYLRRLRIERAKHLLANTELALGPVAELSGLKSAAYLCRVFGHVEGSTPLAYRDGSKTEPRPTRSRRTRRAKKANGRR